MHYTLIFNTIAGHIKTAWNIQTTSPGRAAKPTLQLPRAVLTLENVDRLQSGRSIEQTWTWNIAVQFALPTTNIDPQEFIASKCEDLIDLLTPFSESAGSVPAVAGPFGTVGYMPMVEQWSPIPLDDVDNACGLSIRFVVRSTVWQ